MRKQNWPKRDRIKNYFPLPNEIYSLGLSPGALRSMDFSSAGKTERPTSAWSVTEPSGRLWE